jgi:hypothetical protein
MRKADSARFRPFVDVVHCLVNSRCLTKTNFVDHLVVAKRIFAGAFQKFTITPAVSYLDGK